MKTYNMLYNQVNGEELKIVQRMFNNFSGKKKLLNYMKRSKGLHEVTKT